MEPDARKALFNSLSQNSPQALDYTAAPWAETLAAKVRMLDSFTLEERLDFLAAAVRDLDNAKITDSWEIERPTDKTAMETDLDEWIDSILQLQDIARVLQVLF